jgi:hypothetical protein
MDMDCLFDMTMVESDDGLRKEVGWWGVNGHIQGEWRWAQFYVSMKKCRRFVIF